MNVRALLVAAALALTAAPAWAGPLSVTLTPGPANPPSPQMGDNLSFHSVIRNDATTPVDGVIAWLSLVQIDQGKEQPVDLEDWSAHKAVTAASLAPGENLETDWPIRLIQSGTYRVVVSAVTRDSVGLMASPFADFTVRQKPVVESQRVLPVALGIPLVLGGLLTWRQVNSPPPPLLTVWAVDGRLWPATIRNQSGAGCRNENTAHRGRREDGRLRRQRPRGAWPRRRSGRQRP
jgi:hypothetical protein